MMNPKEKTSKGKFLSLILRHQPETIGLMLDAAGWTSVAELLAQLAAHGHPMSAAELEILVATNDKQRYAFNTDHTQIRANQGHSLTEVDLGLTPQLPPEILFHGTAQVTLAAILATGLEKRSRQHVHLSLDSVTARKVGARHGKPVVLQVAAGAMYRAGHAFYQADNGVWLTDAVAPQYLEVLA